MKNIQSNIIQNSFRTLLTRGSNTVERTVKAKTYFKQK